MKLILILICCISPSFLGFTQDVSTELTNTVKETAEVKEGVMIKTQMIQ